VFDVFVDAIEIARNAEDDDEDVGLGFRTPTRVDDLDARVVGDANDVIIIGRW
jgi:hypothetical protein